MSERDQLLSILRELCDLLFQHGDTHWSAWFRKASDEIQADDFHGIIRVLDAFGGMGSFNDFSLAHVGGIAIPDGVRETVNASLDSMRSRVYDLANEIRRLHRGK